VPGRGRRSTVAGAHIQQWTCNHLGPADLAARAPLTVSHLHGSPLPEDAPIATGEFSCGSLPKRWGSRDPDGKGSGHHLPKPVFPMLVCVQRRIRRASQQNSKSPSTVARTTTACSLSKRASSSALLDAGDWVGLGARRTGNRNGPVGRLGTLVAGVVCGNRTPPGAGHGGGGGGGVANFAPKFAPWRRFMLWSRSSRARQRRGPGRTSRRRRPVGRPLAAPSFLGRTRTGARRRRR
jgi:hypothetical protein